ncbi:uncharacterized protein [Arachis hypogaea]|uniref:uncharacterized protein n=1 Tax=Arachis hypogaea TaxID=3818 RepID=UPI003B220427
MRDLGKHPQIWNYPINQQDEIRRAYIKFGPYQFIMDEYPLSGLESHLRRFKAHWFKRWLTFQASAFRGHDESHESQNREKFLEILKLLASYNKEVDAVVLENAPQNAIYTSASIQKEILHVFARKVQNEIRNKIGNAKFCLIVDEVRDESKREQMALVRFIDKHGFVKERLIDVVHVKDTTSATLKEEICFALSHHNLNIQNVRGQGYDGASNMRGEWKGLQALIIQECPYAYYVHCFAHQL